MRKVAPVDLLVIHTCGHRAVYESTGHYYQDFIWIGMLSSLACYECRLDQAWSTNTYLVWPGWVPRDTRRPG